MCLHVQFSRGMCTSSMLFFLICMWFRACMFNSLGICARILHFDLLDYFLAERFIGDVEELTREYTFIEKCFSDDSDLPRSLGSV